MDVGYIYCFNHFGGWRRNVLLVLRYQCDIPSLWLFIRDFPWVSWQIESQKQSFPRLSGSLWFYVPFSVLDFILYKFGPFGKLRQQVWLRFWAIHSIGSQKQTMGQIQVKQARAIELLKAFKACPLLAFPFSSASKDVHATSG